jgi:hypothetical protein
MKLSLKQVIGYIIIILFTIGGIAITVVNFMTAGIFYLYTLLGMIALIGIFFLGFWLIKPEEDKKL